MAGAVVSGRVSVTLVLAVAMLPERSVAIADREWTPSAKPAGLRLAVNGAAVETPKLEPSSRNCTFATPALSAALAETVTVRGYRGARQRAENGDRWRHAIYPSGGMPRRLINRFDTAQRAIVEPAAKHENVAVTHGCY